MKLLRNQEKNFRISTARNMNLYYEYEVTAKIVHLSAILVVLYFATAQLSPLVPNSIMAITLGT